MHLSSLKPNEGSVKKRKRVGRGQGSTRGGTSTRGHKGQKSRSGYSKKIGFEGGQMPIQRRIPKFGFTSPNRVEYKAINISTIERLATEKGVAKMDMQFFVDNGLASKNEKVKILAKGKIKAKVEVSAHGFSKQGQEAIEKAGGKAIKL